VQLEDLYTRIDRLAQAKTYTQPWLTEDAAQEGKIAAWEAWQHRPGNEAYAMRAAAFGVLGIATGTRSMTGSSRQGRPMERLVPASTFTAEHEDGDEKRSIIDRPVPATTPDLAYHRREIAAVVSALTPRQQAVVRAVACDELLTPSQRGEWSGRLRPRMAEELAHLRESFGD
jgi:hypothetical protein